MNGSQPTNGVFGPYLVAILGTFLIMAVLVWAMIHYTQPPPIGEERAALRRKNLAELKAANADALNNYAWQDPAKGIVRLPIEQAMKLTVQEWQNPSAARSNLISLVGRATAVPPPAPQKPSEFE